MKNLYLFFAFFIFFSCRSNHDFIVPYDIEKNFPDSKNGITQEQLNEFTIKMVNQIKGNTEGKFIPEIYVSDLYGHKFVLNKMISQITLIYGTDSHCSWGLTVLEDDLPYTLDKLKGDSINLFTIALLVRSDFDSSDNRSFARLTDEVHKKYEHFYIIEEKDAKKLNILNATKLLLDKDQHVISIDFGASLNPNGLYEELKTKLLQTSRQNPKPGQLVKKVERKMEF